MHFPHRIDYASTARISSTRSPIDDVLFHFHRAGQFHAFGSLIADGLVGYAEALDALTLRARIMIGDWPVGLDDAIGRALARSAAITAHFTAPSAGGGR